MAGLAHRCRIDMPSRQTVTAGAVTTSQHLIVIHRDHRRPGRIDMTGLTDIRGINVGRSLAYGGNPIVTTGTAAKTL